MCGISAVVALDSVKSSTLNDPYYRTWLRRSLNKSLATIEHRGPDARSQWISDNCRVAFGHVRLAINDPTLAGEQPFHDKDGVIHAVVNGELYEHQRSKDELGDSYEFTGGSDCEIVIALYLKYGLHFLSKLRGEFSLCLYDSKKEVFIAARDRYGIKPLFWTIVDNRLLLAAEAKAFLALGWRPKWDVRSIIEDGWLHDQRTIFKSVCKVRPGHYLICSSFDHMEEREYWDMDFPDKRVLETRTEEEMILGLRQRLLEAVQIRLHPDAPMGVYLSGGIDSSAVAGMAAHLLKEESVASDQVRTATQQRVTAFCIGFDQASGFDESSIAQRTADALGLQLVTIRMDEKLIADDFEDAVWHCEHHNPDFNYVGKFALSKAVRANGIKVVLTGDGSDEHLGGYEHFLADYFREPDLAWPEQPISEETRQRIASSLEQESEAGYSGIDRTSELRSDAVARQMLNNTSICHRLWSITSAPFSPWTKCYGDLSVQQTRANNPSGRNLYNINHHWHPLNTSMYVWNKSVLTSMDLVCLGERMEMAHSIESRLPFLDHHLTEYVNSLPPSMKIRKDSYRDTFTGKWILRKAAKPFITKEVYHRKKHPYTGPIVYTADGPLHQLFSGLITRDNVERLGFVEWPKVVGLVDRAFGPEKDRAAMRTAITVAQWIVLSQRLGIARAEEFLWDWVMDKGHNT